MEQPKIAIGNFIRTPMHRQGVVVEIKADGHVRYQLCDKQLIFEADSYTVLPTPIEDIHPGHFCKILEGSKKSVCRRTLGSQTGMVYIMISPQHLQRRFLIGNMYPVAKEPWNNLHFYPVLWRGTSWIL